MMTPLTAFAQGPDLVAQTARGNDAMKAGRYDEAAAIYSDLARALPNDAGILLNLGMAYSMAGKPREAIKPLERAVKLQPSLHAAWLFLGSAYLEAGKAREALKPLLEAAATDAGRVRARQLLAQAYVSLRRYGDAERELRKLLEIDELNANGWYALGQAHEEQARRAFEVLQQNTPGSPYEALIAADVLASQKEYGQAIELYRAVLEELPSMRAAHAALADVYELSGDAAAAAAERVNIEKLPPPDCTRNKAECAFLQRRYREAIAAVGGRQDAAANYWRAMAHNELALEAFARLEQLPPSPESHAFRAELYRSQGRHPESASELRKAAKLAPTDRAIQRELATSLYLSRDYDGAEPLLRELLKQQPASAELNFMLGDTLLQAQKVEEAVPRLEAAVAANSGLGEARLALGRAYVQLGRAADAIPHLKAALASDDDGSVHYQLARAYQASGQPELAKQMMEKYAALQKDRRQ